MWVTGGSGLTARKTWTQSKRQGKVRSLGARAVVLVRICCARSGSHGCLAGLVTVAMGGMETEQWWSAKQALLLLGGRRIVAAARQCRLGQRKVVASYSYRPAVRVPQGRSVLWTTVILGVRATGYVENIRELSRWGAERSWCTGGFSKLP